MADEIIKKEGFSLDEIFFTPTMAEILQAQGDQSGASAIKKALRADAHGVRNFGDLRPSNDDSDLEMIRLMETWLENLKGNKHVIR